MKNQAELVKGFLSKEECDEFINFFENNLDQIEVYLNNSIIFPGPNIDLKNKVIDFVTKSYNVRCNYLQLVKWPDGTFMDNHYDGTVVKDNDYTCICYLNSDYTGGRTFIQDNYIDAEIGDLLFFNSKNLIHGVETVRGTRYTMISWYKQL
jgi:predicted 2-oxoglutarate/Fe(II)-dependent dioxygenase YbiX